VGAGLDWLSFPIAEHVGSRGKVFALEPSAEAVAELTRRAAQQKLAQLVAIETFAEHLPLADQSVDGVIWHTVALMMGDRRQALSESFRIVRPGGRLVVVDWKIIETASGPPLERRVPEDLLAEEARAQGFSLKARFDPGPVTWGLVFQR
jgi:ubiquinone/menaquinone biosynthesis C-methylase UbiE